MSWKGDTLVLSIPDGFLAVVPCFIYALCFTSAAHRLSLPISSRHVWVTQCLVCLCRRFNSLLHRVCVCTVVPQFPHHHPSVTVVIPNYKYSKTVSFSLPLPSPQNTMNDLKNMRFKKTKPGLSAFLILRFRMHTSTHIFKQYFAARNAGNLSEELKQKFSCNLLIPASRALRQTPNITQ